MKLQKSKLDPYSEQLEQWFGEEKITLEAAKARLGAQGCSVSLQRLSDWWAARQQARMQDRLLGQIVSGNQHCEQIEKQFSKNAAPGLETLIKLHRVLILQLSTQASADPALLELVSAAMKPVMEFAKLQTKQEENALLRSKFQRETCELFLTWFADKGAREIVEKPSLSRDAKIEALGQRMFGELW